MDLAEKESRNKKGIQFYCNKLNSFIFIPNTKEQTINYDAIRHDRG